MPQHTALIAGATGAIGAPLARHLAGLASWRAIGLSRRPPREPIAGVSYVQADMTDAAAVEKALQGQSSLTHLFYCGRAPHDDRKGENVAGNLALLDAVVMGARAVAPRLSHIHLVQGGKYYGVHVGPFSNPAREEDPRAIVDNFYYAQEDYLRAGAKAGKWSWSASRPTTMLHYSPTNPRNIVSTLGAYAALCRAFGCALDFPASERSYASLAQFTTGEVLASAMAWMATEPKATGHAFNVANGDLVRWSRFWPRLAAAFDMPVGIVRPVTLADVMADKEEVWQGIVRRHGLQPRKLSEVAVWAFADMTLMRWWDEIQSTNKARAFGFHDWADSEETMLALLARYREARILP